MNVPAIGPTLISTLISRNAEASADLWCDYLYQHRHQQAEVSDKEAKLWGYPALSGSKVIWLANQLNEPWLRIIDVPDAKQRKPFTHYGWLSLEISVQDVDQLYQQIKDSPLEVIGEPANLDVSDNIRAMQVVGLDGEVLYLTEIKAAVPPFELPETRCPVDRLFIPVALVQDREQAAITYEQFEHTNALKFDTKITVINKALGHPIEQKHPVATVQLAGNNLVELDEVPGLLETSAHQRIPTSGIAIISFQVARIPKGMEKSTITNHHNQPQISSVIKTSNGMMELVEKATT